MNRCRQRVYGSGQAFGGSPCSKPVKDGEAFCAIHSPEAVNKRREKSEARYADDMKKRAAERAAAREHDRRAAAYDGLVAALERIANEAAATWVSDVARDAIKKATAP